jgi:hypothetical protein
VIFEGIDKTFKVKRPFYMKSGRFLYEICPILHHFPIKKCTNRRVFADFFRQFRIGAGKRIHGVKIASRHNVPLPFLKFFKHILVKKAKKKLKK